MSTAEDITGSYLTTRAQACEVIADLGMDIEGAIHELVMCGHPFGMAIAEAQAALTHVVVALVQTGAIDLGDIVPTDPPYDWANESETP